jgi:twinkle protein
MHFTKRGETMLKDFGTVEFEKRGIDAEVADRLGCRFENQKFVFEYRSMDAISFRKFRTLDKKWWIEPKGVDLHLWNIDSLRGLGSRPKEPLICTEGEFDCVAIYQACGGFSVSVPNGAGTSRSEGAIYPGKDTGFKYLWGPNGRLIPEIDQFDRIILATDNDEPGILLRDELAVRIGPSRCWFVEYPERCKDANDVLREYGAETLSHVIARAKPMRPGFLVKPSGLPPREKLKTYSTGWTDFDHRIRVMRPELMVVTGIPTHGKTTWVRALAFRMALANGWRTAFFTPEDPSERLKRDMGRFAEFHAKDGPAAWMDAHFRISNPPEDEILTLDMVMAEMESAVFQQDCHVFVIDPWNEISHDRGNRSGTEYIEQTLVTLKRKARRLNLLLIIVAHPKKIESGKPNLYSISESANWYNKCDHGVVIYRSTPDDEFVQVIVEKCKDNETMGRPGTAYMTFFRDNADYSVDDGGKKA